MNASKYQLKEFSIIFLENSTWWLSGKESACSAGGSDFIPGSGRPPEEEMATHSSVLAWEIPRTEEPDGLQWSRKRAGHNLATKQLVIWRSYQNHFLRIISSVVRSLGFLTGKWLRLYYSRFNS